MITITGRLPVNFAGGRYRNPLIIFPSQLFQWISCGSEKLDVFRPPVSLNVQRSTLPVEISSEYTSEVERADVMLNPRSRLFLCHCTSLTMPFGRSGTRSSFRDAVSRTCSTPKPSSLVTNAIFLPSYES